MDVSYFPLLSQRSQKDDTHDDEKQRQSSEDEEEQDDDSCDSDFSIDEDDELRSDLEEEAKAADPSNQKRSKRGQGVQTKAYQEPKRDQDKNIVRNEKSSVSLTSKDKKKEEPGAHLPKLAVSSSEAVRKHTRATTATKTAETAKRQTKRLVEHENFIKRRAQLKAARKDEMRPLTQAEILEEAKITEANNLESLKRFQEMEIEAKKKARNASRKSLTGSYISYRSTSRPLIQEVSPNCNGDSSAEGNGDRICVDDKYEEEEQNDATKKIEHFDEANNEHLHATTEDEIGEEEKQERTFLTFSDDDTFRQHFPGQNQKEQTRQPIQQRICPVTRLPAKYFDPVTKLPYANLQAFRTLREAYHTQLELKGDRNDPEVKEWLERRQKCQSQDQTAARVQVVTPPSRLV